jgi:hypothetical protein
MWIEFTKHIYFFVFEKWHRDHSYTMFHIESLSVSSTFQLKMKKKIDVNFIKFGFSKKATKINEIFSDDLPLTT